MRGIIIVLLALVFAAPVHAGLFCRGGQCSRADRSERSGLIHGQGALRARFLRRREAHGPLRLFGQRATSSESQCEDGQCPRR